MWTCDRCVVLFRCKAQLVTVLAALSCLSCVRMADCVIPSCWVRMVIDTCVLRDSRVMTVWLSLLTGGASLPR